ncbi:MAG: adenylosuccinate lyase [Candidatus Falkowbacteria bacterium]|nr:adenylosuccinate lyase [Candidatus Falkowbacteria bacterium]
MYEVKNFSGHAISPVDGRYCKKVEELSEIFSEFALMRYRVYVEVEYLIALHSIIRDMGAKPFVREINPAECELLRNLYLKFSDSDLAAIKNFERTTNHDVKAVEYFIRSRMSETSLSDVIGFVHYGKTSEDINNIAYALMLRDGTAILQQAYEDLTEEIGKLAEENKNVAMLALTHGQPASPTALGWEMNIFAERLKLLNKRQKDSYLSVKWGGATGADNALYAAHPEINWRYFSINFIDVFNNGGPGTMKFVLNDYTNQIEPHDTYAKLFSIFQEENNILLSFAQNMWGYISREVFIQKAVEGETGSSTMPQKINPINFENAEGNLGIANALFNHFSNKLPISRFQRDLSDSTVERYFGVAYASTLIALKALSAGLKRLSVNHVHIHEELDNHWEVIAEAYQVILRREGITEGYELLLKLTKGKRVTKKLLYRFIDLAIKEYGLSAETAQELEKITPHNYVGNRNF